MHIEFHTNITVKNITGGYKHMIDVFITCKCGKQNIWIADATFTKKPCPECGRRYIGKYNRKTLTIEPVEIKSSNKWWKWRKYASNRNRQRTKI